MSNLRCFVEDTDQLELALSYGVDEPVLCHPLFDARTQQAPCSLQSLSPLIRILQAHERPICLNVDIQYHQHQHELLTQLGTLINEQPIDTLRIQDLGLLHAIHQQYPHLSLCYCPDTSQQNYMSIQALEQTAKRHFLNNELALSDIQRILDHCQGDFELQIFGPILIQYSYRRFYADLSNHPKQTPHCYDAEDKDHPNRFYRMIDNHHGHLMMAHFHRNLLPYLSQLMPLHLRSYIVESRGESTTYLDQALNLVTDCLAQFKSDPNHYQFDRARLDPVQQLAKRPFKAGFFRANLTDQDRPQVTQLTDDTLTYLGQIIHIDKGSWMSIELETHCEVGDQILIATPEDRRIQFPLSALKDLDGTPINKSHGHEIIQMPWKKGVSTMSRVYRQDPPR